MDAPLDELYFTWLYSQVASLRLKRPSRTYWSLLRQLYTKDFVWFVANDDNRVEDGRELRNEFLDAEGIEIDGNSREWESLPCSFLELLIGLSRRLAYEAEGQPTDWFWKLLSNMDLDGLTDAVYTEKHRDDVDEYLNMIIFRTYNPDGGGGLFPLRAPTRDQTNVEIWYQMSAYILEGD